MTVHSYNVSHFDKKQLIYTVTTVTVATVPNNNEVIMFKRLREFFNPSSFVPLRDELNQYKRGGVSQPWYKPAWQPLHVEPSSGNHIVIVNGYGAINTDVRQGDDSFSFNDNDVCWCYLDEFNFLKPDFLRVGVFSSDRGVFGKPGGDETKAGGHKADSTEVSDDAIKLDADVVATRAHSIVNAKPVDAVAAYVNMTYGHLNDDQFTDAKCKKMLAEFMSLRGILQDKGLLLSGFDDEVSGAGVSDYEYKKLLAKYVDLRAKYSTKSAESVSNDEYQALKYKYNALKRFTRELVNVCVAIHTDGAYIRSAHDELIRLTGRFANGDWLIDRKSSSTKNSNS